MSPANNNNSFYYGIANYVIPHHWDVQVGPARSVYVSFGIHPHVAAQGVTSKQLDDLDFLLGNHKCVAVEEIGLDYTSRCNCRPCRTPEPCGISLRECQEGAFIDMLLIARRRQYRRDHGSGDAASRALSIIVTLLT
jgi:Tat protein secretion system quality control protein TatD with DNase activity